MTATATPPPATARGDEPLLSVRDLRVTAAALSSVAEKVDQQGASSLIGQQKLPDYKGK